jgi:hypothetical protein
MIRATCSIALTRAGSSRPAKTSGCSAMSVAIPVPRSLMLSPCAKSALSVRILARNYG